LALSITDLVLRCNADIQISEGPNVDKTKKTLTFSTWHIFSTGHIGQRAQVQENKKV
jgi:hypothetical protein